MRTRMVGAPSAINASFSCSRPSLISKAASTAACASVEGSQGRGTPKTASMPSPVNLFTIPARLVTAGTQTSIPRLSQSISSRGLSPSDTLVKDAVSVNSEVIGSC